MRKLSIFVFIVLLSRITYGANVIELSTFPKSSDSVVWSCYEQATAATWKGKALCDEEGSGDYWVCPSSKEIRLKALEQCKTKVQTAKDQPAMLYLLGLLHQDFNYQPDTAGCPEYFRYQEGSAVCVYTNDHFEQLISKFPESAYADMAAVKQAEKAYRYYECEGQVLCSIENQIVGWVNLLEKKPASRFADLAINKVVESLNSLSKSEIDPRYESPRGLLGDVQNLRTIAGKLSQENRVKLTKSLDQAEDLLRKIQESKPSQKAKRRLD